MLFVILLASFVVIGASSAAEINDDISVDNVVATNIVTDEIDSVGTGADDGVVEVDNEADLKSAINNDSVKEIKITKDIALSEFFNVPVSHSNLKIDGQNHKLSPADNYNTTYPYGALCWSSDNGTLTNCVFAGFNNPNIKMGAVCWDAEGGHITNCNFVNCESLNGGAILYSRDNGIIKNCNFSNNIAKDKGNSIFIRGSSITIDGCKFSQTHGDYSDCEIYVEAYAHKIKISNNVMLTKPPKKYYAALYTDYFDDFDWGDGSDVFLANNVFGYNCIKITGYSDIYSPVKLVLDSKVVKKGDIATVKGTFYDDNGNYIISSYIFVSLDGKGVIYEGKLDDFSYYFNIPTKDLKVGVHKFCADFDYNYQNVTCEGTLTVLANNDTNKTNPIHKGIPMEHTGNPLVVLLIGLATVGLSSLKRKL